MARFSLLESNQRAEWQLRIDNFRVFYDVRPSGPSVNIVAVGWKELEQADDEDVLIQLPYGRKFLVVDV